MRSRDTRPHFVVAAQAARCVYGGGGAVVHGAPCVRASFLKTPKLRKWSIEQGNLWEKTAQNAQIRTLLDEQRQMIIAEYCEKIGHHELQAARAEEEHRILRKELWRQHMDFREVYQQGLTEMEELRKFQSSTFDTLARRKLIEDQNTIMELSGGQGDGAPKAGQKQAAADS